MPVYAYLGEPFSRTHENQAFDELYRQLRTYWGELDEPVTLIGNVTCNAHELDALLIKPGAIAVLDFKDFGGRLEFTENGPWMINGVKVKGGSKQNPFKQLQANKFALMDWFNTRQGLIDSSNNLGHIAAVVIFHKPVEFDPSQLPPKIASWFHITDLVNGLERLVQLSSPSMQANAAVQERIAKSFNVSAYRAPDELVSVVGVSESQPATSPASFSWTQSQREALTHAETLLNRDDHDALVISGMASTGKTQLARALTTLAGESGRNVVALAPNAAVAHALTRQTGIEFRSIFGHIYDHSSREEGEDDTIIYPLRACHDAPDVIYLIDEAQLLGDAYFDLGGERFGSGHTLSDFLAFINLAEHPRRIVLLGDSYQLKRGGEDQSLIGPVFLEGKGIKAHHHELDQLIDDDTRSGILSVAKGLVNSIKGQVFASLDMPETLRGISLIEASDKEKVLRQFFGADQAATDATVLTFSNNTAQNVARFIRKTIRGYATSYPQPGDRVELFSPLRLKPPEDELQPDYIPHGSVGTVAWCDEESREFTQALKGRDQPVQLCFRSIGVRFDEMPGRVSEFMYLEPFLHSEKPQLEGDLQLAVRVFSETRLRKRLAEDEQNLTKLRQQADNGESYREGYQRARDMLRRKRSNLLAQDEYFNAARIRFAYASTCHHAQGRHWPELVIDASYDDKSRDNEGYFRWLYTAITRASDHVNIANFTPLSPLDNVLWRDTRAVVTPSLKSLFRLPYPKEAALTKKDLQRTLPDGLENPDTELINLWLYVADQLAPHGFKVSAIRQKPWQEHYILRHEDGVEATLGLHYNGKHDVTAIRHLAGEPAVAEQAIALLGGSFKLDDPFARASLEAIQPLLEQGGFRMEGVEAGQWHFRITVADTEAQKANIKVHYSSQGKISTIEAEKATDEAMLHRLGGLFSTNQ